MRSEEVSAAFMKDPREKKTKKTKKTPGGEPSPAMKHVRTGLRIFGRAFNFVGDTAAGTVGVVFKIIGTVLMILLVSGMMFACVFAYYVKTCLTPNLDLSLEDFKLNESSTVWYQDASGEWRELANLSGKEKRVWVDYDEIPWYMEKALVAIEDKRFYNHKGVDWYRTAGAFVEMFARMQTSYGGSTITQQLIKNLTGENEVTIQRKLTEIFGALELEKKYDKREIMEWYLNAVYFGEGCWGVQTAAQTYFGKDVKDLSMAECAAIVGITNLPTYYDPFYNEENNKKRQETILWEMYDQGYIDHAQYEQAKSEELAFTRTPGEEYTQEIMSYYTEMVIDDVINDLMKLKGIGRDTAKTLLYNGGYQIYCCLDTGVQACIDQIYTNLKASPAAWGRRSSTSGSTARPAPTARPARPSSPSPPTDRRWTSASSRPTRSCSTRTTSPCAARAGSRRTTAARTSASSASTRRCSTRSTPWPRRSWISCPWGRRPPTTT